MRHLPYSFSAAKSRRINNKLRWSLTIRQTPKEMSLHGGVAPAAGPEKEESPVCEDISFQRERAEFE